MRPKEKPSQRYARLLEAAAEKHNHVSRRRPSRALTVAYFRWAVRCPTCGPAWAGELQRELAWSEQSGPMPSERRRRESADSAYLSLRDSQSFQARQRLLRKRKELRGILPPWPEIPNDEWPFWEDDEVRDHLIGVREPTPDWVLQRNRENELRQLSERTHFVAEAIAGALVEQAHRRYLQGDRKSLSNAPRSIDHSKPLVLYRVLGWR